MKNFIIFAAASIVCMMSVRAGTHRDRRDNDWVYPNDYFVPNIPESCVNSTFCPIKCTKYPQAIMDDIVTRDNLDRFSVEEFEIGNRALFDESDTESTLCSSDTRSEAIFEALDPDGEWRYIIQSSARKYQQILITSICSTPKGACNNIAVFQSSVIPRCEQQYSERLLFSLGKEGELVRGRFRIPSCCVCTYTYKGL